MKQNRTHTPIINLNLNEEFTKDSNKLLRELLEIFVKEIPGIQKEIKVAFDSQEIQKLDDLLHKLYGSCIYCGLDRLKLSLETLKDSVSNGNYSEDLFNLFNKEIENVVKAVKKI